MIIRTDIEQNSLEWLTARAGVVTASEFDNLLTPLWKIKDGDGPKSYLARKVAESWTGSPMAGFNSIDMEFGKILEEEARPFATLELGVEISQVGLITTDNGRVGCSPDGLIGDDCGIEIKCPRADTHVRYLMEGVLPKDYVAQVHGSMFVSERKRWVFLSYCRNFPPLILTIERDEVIQAKIGMAIAQFLIQFDAAMAKLTEINGGPSRRALRQASAPAPAKEEYTAQDLGVTP